MRRFLQSIRCICKPIYNHNPHRNFSSPTRHLLATRMPPLNPASQVSVTLLCEYPKVRVCKSRKTPTPWNKAPPMSCPSSHVGIFEFRLGSHAVNRGSVSASRFAGRLMGLGETSLIPWMSIPYMVETASRDRVETPRERKQKRRR